MIIRKFMLMMIVVLIGFSSCKNPFGNDKFVTYYFKVKIVNTNLYTILHITLPNTIKQPFKIGDTILSNNNEIWMLNSDDSSTRNTYMNNTANCEIVEIIQ